MKTLAAAISCLPALIALTILPACNRKDKAAPQPNKPPTVADKIAGVRTWHGNSWIDGVNTPIGPHADTISKISDTVVVFSYSPSFPLTYLLTDSAKGYAQFMFRWGPPTLYYYYKGDSMRYDFNPGGVHNQHSDLHTP